MGKSAVGAGAQRAYSAKGLSGISREKFKHQRKKDYQATLDGRSYDDATITGGITMPIRADEPSGTNNHDNGDNCLVRVDPSNNFPCYVTPRDRTSDASGNDIPVFTSEQQKIANEMLPLMNITGHQKISNVQSGLSVSMESYGPFSLNNLRVKTTYGKSEDATEIGTEESTSDKFKKNGVQPVK